MTSVDMLPDEVLLEIFDFCAHEKPLTKRQIEAWQSLVHVCRRWRSIVFGSPRRLSLQLCCTIRTPVREMLDIWPALPLLILDDNVRYYPVLSVDNIIAALERRDRVCQILLGHEQSWSLQDVLEALQEPFPELTELVLYSRSRETVPDSFLGGSAPRLRSIRLRHIRFPGLPKLLLSAPHLVEICLTNIPHAGYISPEVMVTVLSTMTSLGSLRLEFQSLKSRPSRESRHPPPRTHFSLPVLASFGFEGAWEYLEDLVARIDAPLLNSLDMGFFELEEVVFDSLQFIQFIDRTPRLKAPDKAIIAFGDSEDEAAGVTLLSQTHGYAHLELKILYSEDLQDSYVRQIFTSSFPPFSTLKDLYILMRQPLVPPSRFQSPWQDKLENMPWLELLHVFTSVNNLYVSVEVAPHIILSLHELVGGRTTEVLPVLQNIFLEGLQPSGPVQEGIGKFITTRQVAGFPISVSGWHRLGGIIDGL